MADAAISTSPTAAPPSERARRGFSFWFLILIAAVVVYGFGHTLDRKLIRPAYPRNPILWLHLAASLGWLGLMIAQAGLVRAGSVRLHRRIGPWGLAFGAVVIGVTLATVFVVRREVALHSPGRPVAVSFLALDLANLLEFAGLLLLAALWRRKPDRHRPLMLLAACSLTIAALARIPAVASHGLVSPAFAGLMLAAMAGDAVERRRLNPVYLLAAPVLYVLIDLAAAAAFHPSPAWMSTARLLLGLPQAG